MKPKVLLVDDDHRILDACKRTLRRDFDLDVAEDGRKALELVCEETYAVIISDMRMPGMDGIRFLQEASEVSPDSILMMLTGDADQTTAAAAVNDGNVFRFMTKPCRPAQLREFISAGIMRFYLQSAERQVIEQTLNGAVKALTEIVDAVDPRLEGRTQSIRGLVRRICAARRIRDPWQIDLAAMLAQIGRATVPPSVLAKHEAGEELSSIESEMLARCPQVGHDLLVGIPRFEPVARIVLYQRKKFDGTGFPASGFVGDAIPLGARILKIATDLVEIEADGVPRKDALATMRCRDGWYDPELLDDVAGCLANFDNTIPVPKTVSLGQLRVGDRLCASAQTTDKTVSIPAGTVVSASLLEKLKNCDLTTGFAEPLSIDAANDEGGDEPWSYEPWTGDSD